MNFRDIRVLYTMELRSALRERAIVVNSILMPIFLYPVLLWVIFSAMMFIRGQNEGFTSRVALLQDPPSIHLELVDSLEAQDDVEIIRDLQSEEAIGLVRTGEMDAVLSFLPGEGSGGALPDNFRAQLFYDESEARSRVAVERIEDAVSEYGTRWTGREADSLGISAGDRLLFLVSDENVSSDEDLGALILGMLIPLFLTIMVALGCFYPAVDTTAGERERSTWETTMTTSASHRSVITAKYLYVATMGVGAGVLNVLAIFATLGAIIAPLLGQDEGVTFSVPFMAIPVMILGAMGLALMISSAMMILAAFARTFKDGQAMVQPVYFAALIIPLLMGQQTDRTLSAGMAAIPVANVAMMIRDSINGIFLWPYILESLVVSVAVVAALLWVASFILRFEDFMLGSFDGSFWRFIKDRMGGGRSGKEAA
jgi:sodium transport system permease protein